MATLSTEQLRSIYQQAFVERTTTLSEAGKAYSQEDLLATIAAVRRLLGETLEAADESAFAAQEAPEGEENWSAGQVMTHLVSAQGNMLGMSRTALGLAAVDTPQGGDMQAQPTRAEAQALLAQLNEGMSTFSASIPEGADLDATATHPRFGDMSTRGWLVLVALHEADHVNQIRALG